jgi:hypothetical protein
MSLVPDSQSMDREIPPIKVCLLWINKTRVKNLVKRRLIHEYRCDERLKTKYEESIHFTDTGLVVELEHLKTKTRLKDEKFVSVKGECET